MACIVPLAVENVMDFVQILLLLKVIYMIKVSLMVSLVNKSVGIYSVDTTKKKKKKFFTQVESLVLYPVDASN